VTARMLPTEATNDMLASLRTIVRSHRGFTRDGGVVYQVFEEGTVELAAWALDQAEEATGFTETP
jgi:hypothetical protein